MVMYGCDQAAQGAPDDHWQGPARITGIDGEVVWLQHGGVPVASTFSRMRPGTTAEMLAAQVQARNFRPMAVPPQLEAEGEQNAYLDFSGPEHQTRVHQSADVADRASPAEHSSDADDEPMALEPSSSTQAASKRSVRLTESQAPTLNPDDEEPEIKRPKTESLPPIAGVRPQEDETPLENLLRREGLTSEDPGVRLARTLSERAGSAASTARDRERSRDRKHVASYANVNISISDDTMKQVKGLIKTMQDALEANIKTKTESDKPMLQWLIRWSAMVLSRYAVRADGRTGYERMKGQRCQIPTVKFGETVL